MERFYYYRATIEPKDGCAFYDHSKGIAGYHTPQERKNYITFGTVDFLDDFLASKQARAAAKRGL